MTPMRVSPFRPGPGRSLLLLLVLLIIGSGWSEALGQDLATLRVEENLRAEPRGTILGRLDPGSAFRTTRIEESWVQVEVEGWIWTASLRSTDRSGFDLVVAASPRENLRAEPSGAILGRMAEGTLFEEVDRVPGWSRVRRVAWLWRESVELSGSPPEEGPAAEQPGGGDPVSAGEPVADEVPWLRTGEGPSSILTGPDGDTLALARPGTELRVLAREGNWVRVRLDGWIWSPGGIEGGQEAATPPLSRATHDQVVEDPDAYRSQVVSWELQYVSLERAEPIRTDFYEGEPFLLTRTPGPGGDFVYVAIPPERLEEVEGLIPLEGIRVVGRVRTGSAALTGNVVLDLLEISRNPGS